MHSLTWRKVGAIALAAAVIWWIFTSPDAAAGLVHQIIGLLKDGADGIATFITSVFNGL